MTKTEEYIAKKKATVPNSRGLKMLELARNGLLFYADYSDDTGDEARRLLAAIEAIAGESV
ncbi:MAG TPA: hypothetical protein VI958_12730 [Acidobacteriota bacterium]